MLSLSVITAVGIPPVGVNQGDRVLDLGSGKNAFICS